MKEFIGILPSAGLGSRLHRFRYSKELLPVFFTTDSQGEKIYPRAVAEYSIQAMQYAGMKLCLVVISDQKTEIMRYFSDGRDFGVNIAYLHQKNPCGLADAVNLGFEWFKCDYVCLALPDTIFYPFNAIDVARNVILDCQADLVLGVFPTSKPEQLGPVQFEPDGSVVEILDKPETTKIHNTWGIAVWSPRFSKFLHEYIGGSLENAKQPIGYIFNLAVLNKLMVKAIFFENGKFLDLGTAEGIGSFIIEHNLITGGK